MASATKHVVATKLNQNNDETVPNHVYAKVINLNEKSDSNPENHNWHSGVFCDVMKTLTSARSLKCENGDHHDHFGELNFDYKKTVEDH